MDNTEKTFWANIEKPDNTGDCWNWKGNQDSNGYGKLYVKGEFPYQSGMKGAHRYSWELHNDAIPDGMFCCHHCDNPQCVNPHHLFIGTHQDNMTDMVKKGRANKKTPWMLGNANNKNNKKSSKESKAIPKADLMRRLRAERKAAGLISWRADVTQSQAVLLTAYLKRLREVKA